MHISQTNRTHKEAVLAEAIFSNKTYFNFILALECTQILEMNQPLQKLDTRLSTLTSSTFHNNKKSTQKSLSLQQFLWRSERFPWKILPYMTPNWSQFFSDANISQMPAYRVLSMQHQELLGTLATTSWMATCPFGISIPTKTPGRTLWSPFNCLYPPEQKIMVNDLRFLET